MRNLKAILISILFILLCAGSLGASAEEDVYEVFVPDEITVGLNEYLNLPFVYPLNGVMLGKRIYVTCSDPEAFEMQGMSTDHNEGNLSYMYFRLRFVKKGQFSLYFNAAAGYSKTVQVTVEDRAVSAHASQDVFNVRVGETVPLGITLEGGVLYSRFDFTVQGHMQDDYYFSDDQTEFTPLQPGTYVIQIKNSVILLGEFTVNASDVSNNVRFDLPYDRTSVGYHMRLKVVDGDGETVHPRIEMTEGAECAELAHSGTNTILKATAVGWVTLKAYGTDGSTDTVRLRVYEPPASMDVRLSGNTVAAGESLTVNVTYPEGTWYPLGMGIIPQQDQPADDGLNGPVAFVENGVVTGCLPGTCVLEVYASTLHQYYSITVTDSPRALVIERPLSGFDWRNTFQLSVHDRLGRTYPTVFSASGSYISVTPDGLLSAVSVGSSVITATLTDGRVYTFTVRAVEMPSWLALDQASLSVALNESMYIYTVHSDVGDLSANDWILCSNDETVVRCGDQKIEPVGIGSTVITVWSRYCDAHCDVPVTVTAPTDRIYINGSETAELEVPVNGTVSLPIVRDYYGNAVSVSWAISYQYKGYGNPNSYCIKLNAGNRTVTGYWADGNAELTATSASGAVCRVYVSLYNRSTAASFDMSEYSICTGETAQVNFTADASTNGSRLAVGDVTFTVSDTANCLSLTEQCLSYHKFMGKKPGTATLTAKLWNGKTYSAVLRVTAYQACTAGHDMAWRVTVPPTLTVNGVREYVCSRCGVILDSQPVACLGQLGFAKNTFFVAVQGSARTAVLGTNLSGDKKQSFTWHSSDDTVVSAAVDRITGLKPGTATITVTCGDCLPAVCTIHVVDGNSVATLVLPRSLRRIEENAFEGTAAAIVDIPQGATTICSRAFAASSSLKLVMIPASVTSIADDAFAGSVHVTFLCDKGSYAEQYARNHQIQVAE